MNPFIHALLANVGDEVKDVSSIGETLVYTWFGRPNYAYSEEAQKYWIGSTKDTPSGTTQHITQYDIINDIYVTARVGTVYQKDDHNQAQILIRQSDKRLLTFYVEHNGAQIRWRISTSPLNGVSWGAEKNYNPLGGYSYISPYQASNGNIFIFWRSNFNGMKWCYAKSTDGGETFGAAIELFNDSGTQAYLISSQDGNKVHFVATNGHPQRNPGNTSVYHFSFDMLAETAHKSDGTIVSLPLTPASITLVNATTGNDTSWNLDITTKNGLPRILYTLYPSGLTNNLLIKELWFAEWDGSAWVNHQKIAQTLEGYIEDDATVTEKAYPPASRFDTSNPDVIWMPKQVNSILEIHKVEIGVNSNYIEQITFDSEVDNCRPISVPSSVNNLLWLKKNSYTDYSAYSISLQTKTVQV